MECAKGEIARVKFAQLLASLSTNHQQVVFALLVPHWQQALNN